MTSHSALQPALDWYLGKTASHGPGLGRIIPLAFAAYARVLNSATTPDGRDVRWSDIAGTALEVDAETQWSDIVAAVDPDPRHYYEPANGSMDQRVAGRLRVLLAAQTRLDPTCLFMVWDGYDIGDSIRRAPVVTNAAGRNMHVFQGALGYDGATGQERAARLSATWLPLDGSWCLGNDVHARSVLIGGTTELIGAVLADPGLEAYYLRPWHRVTSED